MLVYFTLVSIFQDSSYCLKQHALSELDQRGMLDVFECGGQTLNLRERLEIVELCDYIVKRQMSGFLYGLRCDKVQLPSFIHSFIQPGSGEHIT